MFIDDIALTLLPGVGVRTAAHLIECFGSAGRVFEATKEELIGRAQIREQIAEEIVKKRCHKQAESEMRFCEKNGITPISATSQGYPHLLRECGDHPHVIYVKGNPEILSRRVLSMVGTRKMSSYGQRACDRLIGRLAEMFPDLVIVSGLAFGVDSACHRAALNYGLATVGVIPTPLPNITPSQHTMLATQMISQGGAVLTEYHSHTRTKGTHYAPRNRIIAGMSLGTVVVESPYKSGTMLTVGMADGYHRSVMAVPGRIGDESSSGTNFLIKNNRAVMICSAEDIARELRWDGEAKVALSKRDLSSLSKDAKDLLVYIKDGDTISIDELADITERSIAELTALLFELELEGAVAVLPGKRYERAINH